MCQLAAVLWHLLLLAIGYGRARRHKERKEALVMLNFSFAAGVSLDAWAVDGGAHPRVGGLLGSGRAYH